MADEERCAPTPRDLAIVWGTAFVQFTKLWQAGIKAFAEAGSAEAPIGGNERDRFVVRESASAGLRASTMRGESFDQQLPGDAVHITQEGPPQAGWVLMSCRIDEARIPRVQGDVYRGTVVDAQGEVVSTIALDVGS
jgi:hypothetical protein